MDILCCLYVMFLCAFCFYFCFARCLQPISIIAPFIQGNRQHSSQNMSSSTKSLLSSNNNSTFSTPHNSFPKRIQRNQSFHGFQDNFQVPNQNYFHPFVFGSTQSFCTQHSAFSNFGAQFGYGGLHNQKFVPSIFNNLPSNFNQISGNNTVGAIRFQQSAFNPSLNRVHSSSVLPQFGKNFGPNLQFNFNTQNPFSIPSNKNRSSNRSEPNSDIRRTASGINLYKEGEDKPKTDKNPETASQKAAEKVPKPPVEPFIFRGSETPADSKSSGVLLDPVKRFNSLEIKKHRCYSPTFYSMRCKKHAKRRTVLEIQPLPKKLNQEDKNDPSKSSVSQKIAKIEKSKSSPSKNCFVVSEIPKNSPQSCPNLVPSKGFLQSTQQDASFQHLTDSIQILEQNAENNSYISIHNIPKPAPRNKRSHSNDHIYQNITFLPDSPPHNSYSKNDSPNIKISSCDSTTSSVNELPEIVTTKVQIHNPKIETPDIQKDVPKSNQHNAKNTLSSLCRTKTPNLSEVKTPFSPPPKIVHTNMKPLTESPKGALFQQLQAKTKNFQSSAEKPPVEPKPSPPKGPLILKPTCRPPDVPQKPATDPKPITSRANPACHQNAFYTLTPNIKRLTTPQEAVDPRHFASTLPAQRHMKLMPKALFQDQQVSKSKSFSTRTKHKKHFQIPLQKCHSFKLQTAESYFQPIKSIHEENYLKNGYAPDMGPNYPQESRSHKRDKHKQKGPLVLRRPGDYDKEDMHFHENMQNAVKLQYPQPMYGQKSHPTKPNGIVYADLDMPKSTGKKSDDELSNSSRSHKTKGKTEYATLKFNDVGQEIDV